MQPHELEELGRQLAISTKRAMNDRLEPRDRRIEELERRLTALEASTLDDRLKRLEDRPQMSYCGIWDAQRKYTAGDAVTHAGSLWTALIDSRSTRPGA